MEASRARMLAQTATGADARDDREGARIAAVRRAVRGAAASTSYSTPSARVVVRPETTRAATSEESSPRLTRAAAVLREAKALMRELSPASTLGTPSSAGAAPRLPRRRRPRAGGDPCGRATTPSRRIKPPRPSTPRKEDATTDRRRRPGSSSSPRR